MPNVQIDSALLQNMVNFIGSAGKRFDKAAKDHEQVKAAAPAVVDALVKQGLLAEERKTAAVDALTDSHLRVLSTLEKTASHVKKEAPPTTMGEAADSLDKSAADDSDRGEADRKFLAAMGFGK